VPPSLKPTRTTRQYSLKKFLDRPFEFDVNSKIKLLRNGHKQHLEDPTGK
jgi:hypothetical protein